jgi:DNA-binding GntR family transcriptional regulator
MAQVNEGPMYVQIANAIRAEIRAGRLKPGDKIKSEAELEREHGVSRTVVREAIGQLRADGLIISHQGKGRYVTTDAPTRATQHSPEYEAITASLAQVLSDLRRLSDRLDQLEELVKSSSGS